VFAPIFWGPNASKAVAETAVVVAPVGPYFAINCTSGEFGWAVWANDRKAGSSYVCTDWPLEVSAR